MKVEFAIDPAQVDTLRQTLRGHALLPGDDGYERYRKVWNGMIDRRPGVILRCADTNDVVHAVRFARERDLLVSVRGGGHNVGGLAVCDDGVMIDLSGMRNVAVDPFARRATVQGGATWKDLDTASQAHGLAVTGGHVSSTGVGGLTLGGGFGWLHGKHGLASDNLVSAEVVTADGDVVRANEEENADLLWGLRGGGGNFGVVTSFDFALHPVEHIFVGVFVFPRSRGPELIEAYDSFVASAPHELTTGFVMTVGEDVPPFPPDLAGQELVEIVVMYPDATPEEAERAVKPLRELGAVFEMVEPMPYAVIQTMNDILWAPGQNVYWKSGRIDTLDGAAPAIIDAASGPYLSALIQLGGEIARRPQDASAFGHRDAKYQYIVASVWADGSETDSRTAITRRSWDIVEPHIAGAFVNFLSDDIADRVGDAYGKAHARRLADIKSQYDPDNFFRMNANIAPS